MIREVAVTFQSHQQQLAGILHRPSCSTGVGIVVVVGGGQYRAGSHRQFVKLARFLCDKGISVFRFDVVGMGDSSGEKRGFQYIGDDIRVAIDTLLSQEPRVNKVLLWGLCDGASAALLYGQADERVSALVLVNPWMEHQQAQAKARLFLYYFGRLINREFWSNVLTLKVNFYDSAREFFQVLRRLIDNDEIKSQENGSKKHQESMYQAGIGFNKGIYIILSGRDIVAREFELQFLSGRWLTIYRRSNVHVHRNKDSDHTFSESVQELWLKELTLDICGKYGP